MPPHAVRGARGPRRLRAAVGRSSPRPSARAQATVKVQELQGLCKSALAGLGYAADEIDVLTEVLLYAQVRGNNQGVIKITTGGMDRSPQALPMQVTKETRLSAVICGNKSAGMLVLRRALDIAAEKAQLHGFGIVGTNQTSTSTGCLAYYADALAAKGLIGIVLAQSPEFVAPSGAKQAVFGTNPICIAVPSEQGAVVMDMATAAYAWFGVLEAKTAGRPIPEGVAMDSAGRDTTDPAAVLDGGALKVFDGSPKGSALSLMVELLAGPLVGAAIADKLEERNWGNLVVAIDPAMLQDPADFRRRVQTVLDRVKDAERLPGVPEILLPGERSARAAARVASSGLVEIEDNLLSGLRERAGAGSNGAAAGSDRSGWGLATRLVHPVNGGVEDPYSSMAVPLYQTATFKQPSATENGPFDYTRSGNPTRTILEANMAALEGGVRALAFTTGMAAITAICRLAQAGDVIVAGEDLYGGTSRLLSKVMPGLGVRVEYADLTDRESFKRAIVPGKTRVVLLESPTNPRMQVCNLTELASIAHAAGAIVAVDNSIMTPVYQKPLELGADISMVSATKFVGGHSDVTGGVLSFKDPELADRLYFFLNSEGTGLPPYEAWLALRGLKTMKLRMDKSVENAAAIAAFLHSHPLVTRVNYPGLPSTPGAAVNALQASSGGSLLSFTTGNVDVSRHVVEATQLFHITVSFGSTSSLISLPCYMSHAAIPPEVRAARGLTDDLVRISAGIEDVADLLVDLAAALDGAAALAQPPTVPEPAQSSATANGFRGATGGLLDGILKR